MFNEYILYGPPNAKYHESSKRNTVLYYCLGWFLKLAIFSVFIATLLLDLNLARAAQPADPSCGGVVADPVNAQDYYNIVNPHYFSLVEQGHLGKLETEFARGRWEYALDQLSYILNKVPNHPQALYRLVQLYGKTSNPTLEFVEKKFQCAIYWNKKAPNTRVLYGLFYHQLEKYELAVEQYKIAIGLDVDNAEAHYNLGLSLYELGEFDEAAQEARSAKKLGYPLPGLERKLRRRKLVK